jgi:hypothetical protein
MSLRIIKAKPNPLGKDRIGNLSPQRQLAGEWVDIQNNGSSPIDLTNIKLYHWAYRLPKDGWELIMKFSGSLPAGEIMRIHSSGKIPLEQMAIIDQQGADYHLFSGSGYVWNNDKEDRPTLWNSKTEEYIDRTSYDAYPTEGKILQRVNNKLI